MPTYQYKKYRVDISSAGSVRVKSGDTISGYCAAIYNKNPEATKMHWGEFGRKENSLIKPLENPNHIEVGWVLYHIPSTSHTNAQKQIDKKQLSSRLERLKRIRSEGNAMFDNVRDELLKKAKDIDNFSFQVDMIAVVATAIFTGGFSVGKALKKGSSSIDELTRDIVKRTWSFGMQPQNQGVAQGISQNIANYGDNLEPASDDNVVVASAKILASSFIDMSSPSYWAKSLSGGNGKDEIKRQLEANERARKDVMNKVNSSIAKVQAQIDHERAG